MFKKNCCYVEKLAVMGKTSARVRSVSNGSADSPKTRSAGTIFVIKDFSSTDMDQGDTNQELPRGERLCPAEYDPVKKEVQEKRKLLFKEFAADTSLHGIKYIANPKHHKFRRFVWLVLFLAALVAFLAIGIDHFRQFFEHDVTTTLSFTTEPGMSFPAITICNFNAFRKSAVMDSGWESVIPIILPYLTDSSFPQTALYTSSSSSSSVDELPLPDWDVDELGVRWGHRIEDMLLECRWKANYVCGPADFQRTWTDLGPCHTFNAGNSSQSGGGESPYKINSTTSEEALWIRLTLEQHEYITTPFDTAGFKILIHSRYDAATFLNPGIIEAAPGLRTVIPITKTITKSQKSPLVTNCRDGGLKYYANYTFNTCFIECLADTVLALCGCFLPWMSGGEAEVCDLRMIVDCGYNALASADCSCEVPCIEEIYNTRVSHTATPAQYAIPMLREKYNMTAEELRNNIVDLYFYFDDLRIQVIEHKGAYELTDLTSDIGGEIGLLLGASVLTVFEFLDYVTVYYVLGFSLVRKCFQRITGRRQ